MNWELFYLICFVVGFAFTALSFLSGTLHLHLSCCPIIFMADTEQGIPAAAHAGASFRIFQPHDHRRFPGMVRRDGIPAGPFRHIWVFAGSCSPRWPDWLAQGSFLFSWPNILMAHDYSLDPMDYEMVGVLGKVSGGIRANGTGEIIFEQEGARKACAARSEEREEIERGRRSCGDAFR